MVTLPTFPVQGGCQCGAVRYTLKAPPITFYLCHCTECQKQSASAFGESVQVRPEDVEVTAGELALFKKQGERSMLHGEFCPNCGCRIFTKRPSRPTWNIKGGTLDDCSWLMPAGHIWARSKQPFIHIRPDEISYEGQPENYNALAARWRSMMGLA